MARFLVGIFSIGLLILGAGVVSGQDCPIKPLRILAGAPGGGSDFDARQIALGISGPLGQPVIVDNRPSAIIPGQVVAQAQPDGYTLLVTSSSLWIGPLLQKTPYDALRDFSPITQIEKTVLVVAVPSSVAMKSVNDLMLWPKASRESLTTVRLT